ncbi:MAG: HAMP domain-containing sensor histidine kinase [Methylicorpusculum sp.]|uniref:HAMP domain-containing sensor histidine kinase n=1 Tax=Methylicorpusculum sp. TaxID=2713644 RepID=UPI0027208114|nr:HAMP domain-containing sensor histidine kinase [Methylicorpusculum sp.]MDO8842718.1 HAMP domain-containing sensor histidine kinase [Methylicorpusculum sp.]MDO8938588.1 HAMP domain-containing sensor histidine kinase [Methylicorpusculum sp.]MDP2178602.1 HAMP domain-containing sensor histidine kinase [Methylicorpusculum sp.]MDP2200958.1 HAMP domain-containing sensor histidine kinase [Methylicorpusculum sp.]MDP3531325.1 HAMP domain-containing sensor histidine kinase [Methylicorpusculum sp.]
MSLLDRYNIQQRFNLLIFISIFLASCFLIGFMNKLISNYINDYTSHYWREHTATFADSAIYSVILGSTSQSESVTHSFASDKNVVGATIYDNQGEILASYGTRSVCELNPAFRTEEPSDADNRDSWCFYSPIYQESYLGYVELVISKAEYDLVMRKLLLGSILIILVFSLFFIVIVRRLSRLFTSTLMEMARVLNKVSVGERGNRVHFSGSSEINNMRITLNEMLANIETTEAELEKSVEERTSALKIALESSETANVYKAQIMSMVSHEMKTPLHAIGGYLQLLAERLPDDPAFTDNRALHAKALVRVNDLNNLIDNILLHAKLEADRYEVALTSIAIAPLINACAENVTPLLNRNRNQLQLIGSDAVFVSDSEVLRHILNNLLSNACKFTTDGVITLTWRLSQAFLIIEVADTGCGIPAEFCDQIFDPWWQVDMSLSRRYGGHGLGLAITKQFVQRLNGDISVEPNLVCGSVFTIRIPNSKS